MIEFPITLTSGGSVCLPGRAYALALGYTKNRGVYRLAVTASGEWEGLAIRCFWHVPDGKDPASSLVEDGYVAVPASVTAQPGSGCITFEGSDGAKVMTSADLRYRVSANSGTEDGTEPEPGTPAWQQLVDAVHTDATAAEQAKNDAQTAAQQAGASAKKAGKALSDTITAKEDALKAIGDKQSTATQAVDTARDKALKQVKASTEAAQTAANEAATSAGNADQSAQKAAGSLQALKDGIAAGDFKGEPGNDLTLRSIKREISARRDVAYWLDRAYTHLDSGLLDADDIAEVEALAQAYYDALDAKDKADQELKENVKIGA